MPSRLVIPAGASPSDRPYAPRRQETYQEFADQAGVEGIANLGDQWCQDYGITGLGIATPTETLAERTAREQAAFEAGANRRTIEERAAAFITATTTYLAIPTPTNAQVAAQVRRNAQATIGLVKIMLNDLDDVDGTG